MAKRKNAVVKHPSWTKKKDKVEYSHQLEVAYGRVTELNHYVLQEGDISNKKYVGLWHREGDEVFIRCLNCRKILRIDWDDIQENGFVSPCVVCDGKLDRRGNLIGGCGSHHWVKIDKFWDGEEKRKK